MAQSSKMVENKQQLSRKEMVIEAKDTVVKMLLEDETTSKSAEISDDDFQKVFDKHVDKYIAKGFNLDDSIELVEGLYNSILDDIVAK